MVSSSMGVKYRITKLDKRFTGYPWFTHHITITHPKNAFLGQYEKRDTIIEFSKIREWCWSTWGPSCELYDYTYMKRANVDNFNLNEYWSWNLEKTRRIYLTEKGKIWFDLTWT